ncbi:hypothetical protein BGZ60DRAFT_154530 [Tricladium varicosporioides]|nr:hypothetical protein BGZ60DRAFT_154530 [Hymenoscyphus varicosporioides]
MSVSNSNTHVFAPNPNRACQHCQKAKAKCTPQEGADSSDRCARCCRLNKDCSFPPRRPRKKRSPNHAASTAQLEEKIESLVSLLAGAQAGALKSTHTSPPENGQDRQEPRIEPITDPSTSAWIHAVHGKDVWNTRNTAPNLITNNSLPSPRTIFPATPNSQFGSGHVPLNPSPSTEEDRILDFFKSQFAIHIPFQIISPSLTATQLRNEMPWLHRAIMMVASEDRRARQIEMSKQLAADIATAMMWKGEKSLDMLQALIIYNLWAYYISPVPPQLQSTAVFQLAHALVFDLGLHKPVRDTDTAEILPDSTKVVPDMNPKEVNRTLEERRTVLACYFSSSVLSLCTRKTEGMHQSTYYEYCCKVLQEAAEWESDFVLVALFRLQTMTETFWRNLSIRSAVLEGGRAPNWICVKAVRTELEQFWASLAPNVQQNDFVIMAYHSAHIFLYESSLAASAFPSNPIPGTTPRLDMLYPCLMSTKAVLIPFLSLEQSSYRRFSLLQLSHLGHALSTLFKLSLIDEPGWDLGDVRRTASVTEYFDTLIAHFERAGKEIDSIQREPARDCFATGCARAMRRVKAVYEAKAAGTQIAGGENPCSHGQINAAAIDANLTAEQFDWIDDAYWQELMNDGSLWQS